MQTLNGVNNSERKASKMQPAQSAGKRMWQVPIGPLLLILVEWNYDSTKWIGFASSYLVGSD